MRNVCSVFAGNWQGSDESLVKLDTFIGRLTTEYWRTDTQQKLNKRPAWTNDRHWMVCYRLGTQVKILRIRVSVLEPGRHRSRAASRNKTRKLAVCMRQ